MVQLHELELHRPEQVLGLVQQPLVDVCVNGLLNTVQFYATTDSEVEVALKLFSTNALVESNLSAYSGDGI